MYDLLIKGGRVIDGSGLPGFQADVAMKGGKIVQVGRASEGAARTIDAEGLIVAPGFIDMHTHYDAQAFWDPLLTSSSWNGVTTVIMGNCGCTLAPCQPQDHEYLAGMLARVEGIPTEVIARAVPFTWRSFGEFLAAVDRPRGINVATMVGHSAVRRYVMGDRSTQGPADQREMEKMRAAVHEAVVQGAFGFTTSQAGSHWLPSGEPVPSRLATLDEIYQLGLVLKESGNGSIECVGLVNTSEGQDLVTRLSLELGRQINWNEWSEFPDRPNGWKEMMQFMEAANRRGAQVYGVARCQSGDREFDLKHSFIHLALYPKWRQVLDKPIEERIRLLGEAETRRSLKEGLKEGRRVRWEKTAVSQTVLEKNRPLDGRTLDEIAREQGKEPVDALLDLALEEGLDTEFAFLDFTNEDQEAVRQIIRSPYAIVGISDGGAHVNSECGPEYSTYFLSKWVRERQALTLEAAIRKLTFMPASLMGLWDRGLLRRGMAADITIFDAQRVAPLPKKRVHDLPGGGARLVVHAEGVRYTVISGQVVLEDGKATGALPGRLLRSGEYRE